MVVCYDNLDALTVPELTGLIQQGKARLQRKRENARFQLLNEMRSKAADLGTSLDALIRIHQEASKAPRKPRSDTGKPLAPKYRGPNGETWSGRGRRPRWMDGKDLKDFAI